MTTEHKLKVKTSAGAGVLTLNQRGRQFDVIELMVGGTQHTFGFRLKAGAVNLDEFSDAWQCFGISSRVQVGATVLGNETMRAVCVEDIAAALAAVSVACFNPEEI